MAKPAKQVNLSELVEVTATEAADLGDPTLHRALAVLDAFEWRYAAAARYVELRGDPAAAAAAEAAIEYARDWEWDPAAPPAAGGRGPGRPGTQAVPVAVLDTLLWAARTVLGRLEEVGEGAYAALAARDAGRSGKPTAEHDEKMNWVAGRVAARKAKGLTPDWEQIHKEGEGVFTESSWYGSDQGLQVAFCRWQKKRRGG